MPRKHDITTAGVTSSSESPWLHVGFSASEDGLLAPAPSIDRSMSVGELHNGHHMRGWVRQPSGYRPMGTFCSQLNLGTDSQGKQHGPAGQRAPQVSSK